MTAIRNFAAHVVTAATALALSIALFGGTVSNPGAAVVSAASQESMA